MFYLFMIFCVVINLFRLHVFRCKQSNLEDNLNIIFSWLIFFYTSINLSVLFTIFNSCNFPAIYPLWFCSRVDSFHHLFVLFNLTNTELLFFSFLQIPFLICLRSLNPFVSSSPFYSPCLNIYIHLLHFHYFFWYHSLPSFFLSFINLFRFVCFTFFKNLFSSYVLSIWCFYQHFHFSFTHLHHILFSSFSFILPSRLGQ